MIGVLVTVDYKRLIPETELRRPVFALAMLAYGAKESEQA